MPMPNTWPNCTSMGISFVTGSRQEFVQDGVCAVGKHSPNPFSSNGDCRITPRARGRASW